MTASQLAGGFGLLDARAVPRRVEERFRERVGKLPGRTRLLLLTASAEPIGDPVLLWQAARELGVTPEDVAPAEEAGLLDIGARVVFRHPLVRSATYRAASPDERRRVHRALAAATDPDTDPDRRAWHEAYGAPGPDENIAAALERCAGRARARGGLAAAAAFLGQAVALTPESPRRGPRAISAAEASLAAGGPDHATELLSLADAGPLTARERARLHLSRARIALAINRGSDAPPLLLSAARHLDAVDADLARATYLEAITGAVLAGRFAAGNGIRSIADAARIGAPQPGPARPRGRLLNGWVRVLTDGWHRGAPELQRALKELRAADDEELSGLLAACNTAVVMWDFDAWRELSDRQVKIARRTGALTWLPLALKQSADPFAHAGELTRAEAIAQEITAAVGATDIAIPPYTQAVTAAFRGQEQQTNDLVERGVQDGVTRGEGLAVTYFHWVKAFLANSLSKSEQALDAARAAVQYPDDFAYRNWGLVELIEAAARTGETDNGAESLAQLAEMTQASGTHWALGVEARSRALLSDDGQTAEDHYLSAIDHLEQTDARVDLARAHLLYGEWLRRAGRRIEARARLRSAHTAFVAFGCDAFSERAAHELATTGERVRKRSATTAETPRDPTHRGDRQRKTPTNRSAQPTPARTTQDDHPAANPADPAASRTPAHAHTPKSYRPYPEASSTPQTDPRFTRHPRRSAVVLPFGLHTLAPAPCLSAIG